MTDELKKIEEDISELKLNHASFAKKQTSNEIMLTALAADIKAHFKEERGFEKTLRNIDNTVKGIEVKLADDKYSSYKSLQAELHPVYDLIRDHKEEFAEFKTNAQVEHNCIGVSVEKRIQYQASALVTVCGAILYLVYGGLIDKIDTNSHNLEKHVDNFNLARSQHVSN